MYRPDQPVVLTRGARLRNTKILFHSIRGAIGRQGQLTGGSPTITNPEAGEPCLRGSADGQLQEGNNLDRWSGLGNNPDCLGEYHWLSQSGALRSVAKSSACECTPNFL